MERLRKTTQMGLRRQVGYSMDKKGEKEIITLKSFKKKQSRHQGRGKVIAER